MTVSASLSQTFLDALNTHDPGTVLALLGPNFVFQEVGGTGSTGRNAFAAWLEMVYAAIPDILFRLVRESEDGELTHLEVKAFGTHQGEFLNVPATGTPVTVSGVFTLHGRDLINRLSVTIDFGSLRRQLLQATRR